MTRLPCSSSQNGSATLCSLPLLRPMVWSTTWCMPAMHQTSSASDDSIAATWPRLIPGISSRGGSSNGSLFWDSGRASAMAETYPTPFRGQFRSGVPRCRRDASAPFPSNYYARPDGARPGLAGARHDGARHRPAGPARRGRPGTVARRARPHLPAALPGPASVRRRARGLRPGVRADRGRGQRHGRVRLEPPARWQPRIRGGDVPHRLRVHRHSVRVPVAVRPRGPPRRHRDLVRERRRRRASTCRPPCGRASPASRPVPRST